MKFVDEVSVTASGGDGGSGAISWRREKYLPRGGPDGGNGGTGGAVVFRTDSGRNTLLDLSYNPLIRAGNGCAGAGALKDGSNGKDSIVRVPVGTQVFYQETLIADLAHPKAQWVAARGGRGGKGNTFFKNALRRAPDFAQPGESGESFDLRLVLKSVADVGLIGLPNVGKSTLISKTTRSHPEIADYPFTTLTPNLGVVLKDGISQFVIADIPGLIPGAHTGKGLGIRFLKHVERTKILVQLIDVGSGLVINNNKISENPNSEDPQNDALKQFSALDHELTQFSPALAEKPRVVVFAKIDLERNRVAYELTHDTLAKKGYRTFAISAHTGEGLENLMSYLTELTTSLRSTDY